MVSGKFVLRLDPKTHSALKEEAQAKGESLNSLCLRKLLGSGNTPWAEVVSEVIHHFKPLGIILFGSTARGEATSKSDIDLLVVLPGKAPISRALYTLWDREFQNFEKFSPQFVHLPHGMEVGGIWLEASIDGDILFDSEDHIKKCLQQVRVLIAEGVYQRKMNNGHPYWKRQDSNAK